MQYNHDQSGSSGNGNSGNNGNGEVPPGQNVDENGNITNNGGNTPPGLNRRNWGYSNRAAARKCRKERHSEAFLSPRALYFLRTVCYGITVQVSANYFYIV